MGRSGQRGVALITVLLVFALAAVVAAEMLRRSHQLGTGFGNQLNARQAYYYALGGEAFARQLLALDLQRGESGRDTLEEAWATLDEGIPFDIEYGKMKVEIVDLQGRFNLNNVVDDSGQPRVEGVEQMRRLLQALGLNARYAAEWQDWLDRDQQRQDNGAEDADYEGYRTAGQREADISALRLLRSMQPEDYRRLAPHVTVLPEVTAINVNTADAPTLRALVPNLSASLAGQLVARQQSGGFATLEAFEQLSGTAAGEEAALASSYFEVRVTVQYDDRWQYLRTVLQRDSGGELQVVSRERGLPFAPDDNDEPGG